MKFTTKEKPADAEVWEYGLVSELEETLGDLRIKPTDAEIFSEACVLLQRLSGVSGQKQKYVEVKKRLEDSAPQRRIRVKCASRLAA